MKFIDHQDELENYPILSTIQVALKNLDGSKIIVIIDALQSIDLTDFINKINNPKIVKILHSPLQDLQIFYQISKKYPKNIYDTQMMANFCEKDFKQIEHVWGFSPV